ncbi:serine/threonine-protein kinase [Chlamydia sp. 17-3921]|uniref:serine/threonine protein kinase n=1 Tax=Chlamydia sp. 17-3921 TaxID=2675798 RepID=UPI001919C5FF|nr:serine/threonine-protein kinase [Chlamydia sp. 17-3921]
MDCRTDFSSEILTIGGYPIKKILSQKVGSLVYQGEHPEYSLPVAIKVLSPPFVFDSRHVQGFLKEAQIIRQASHSNIVKFYNYGKWKNSLYMVMEYVEGFSLRHCILSQFIALPRAINILLAIVEAVQYLHSQGIFHKDIKPENILVTLQGQIKLIDFSLSAWESETASVHPAVLGTPYYMSPEQRQGEPFSSSSDIYSLGVLAYELILGNLSFGKIHLALIPERIGKILAKALQPSSKDRYRSVEEFLQCLQEYYVSGDMTKDLHKKDHLITSCDQLQEQSVWLAPKELSFPSFVSGTLYRIGYSLHPYAHYDTFFSKDILNIWLVYSLSINATLALSAIKSLVSQQNPQLSSLEKVREINEQLNKMNTPVGDLGISLMYLTILKETNELSWISCGKTIFWLRQQGRAFQDFETFSPGLGKINSLQIQESKVAWEIGDEAVICTLQAEEFSSSLKALSFVELKDRRQTAIFCPIEQVRYGTSGNVNESSSPSTLISLKRIR